MSSAHGVRSGRRDLRRQGRAAWTHPAELCHTAASLAVAAGAIVKATWATPDRTEAREVSTCSLGSPATLETPFGQSSQGCCALREFGLVPRVHVLPGRRERDWLRVVAARPAVAAHQAGGRRHSQTTMHPMHSRRKIGNQLLPGTVCSPLGCVPAVGPNLMIVSPLSSVCTSVKRLLMLGQLISEKAGIATERRWWVLVVPTIPHGLR